MNKFERRLRRLVNPLSTGLTMRWHGAGVRSVPVGVSPPPSTEPEGAWDGWPKTRAGVCEASPGDWVVPDGERAGWSWLPPQGAIPNLRAVRPWVRVWYRLPFLDRYAYSYMWPRGGWAVLPLISDTRDGG